MLINKETICSIYVHDFLKAHSHIFKKYQPAKKSWFSKKDEVKEGVYEIYFSLDYVDNYYVPNWEDKFVIIDGIVRHKPFIRLNFIDKSYQELYFEDIKSRDTYINTHFNDRKYLKIDG